MSTYQFTCNRPVSATGRNFDTAKSQSAKQQDLCDANVHKVHIITVQTKTTILGNNSDF